MTVTLPLPLARLKWKNPETGVDEIYDLHEGAQLTVGRSANNEICIPQQHVSRQHISIEYADGMFMLKDLGSANGTFLNDQLIDQPMPLMAGDKIRLYTPEIDFLAAVPDEMTMHQFMPELAPEAELSVPPSPAGGPPRLIFKSGPQKDDVVNLTIDDVKFGRATLNHSWEIGIQDGSVSRPHARLARIKGVWTLYDLGSANGTRVNNENITDEGKALTDGDVLTFGQTFILFRL